ncbi:MAG: hypothetical protein RL582_1284 [Bacteroidota bacterium]|jgi:hypothetical protein
MPSNFISLSEAQDLTSRFRNELDDMLTTSFEDSLPYAETFDASAIQDLINQDGCTQFRAYFGMDENNKVRLVFTAVDAQGEDILDGSNSIIIDNGIRCPNNCPSNLL